MKANKRNKKSQSTYIRMVLRQHTPAKLERRLVQSKGML
jgi:hypothetical protein